MTTNWRESICRVSGTAQIADLGRYVSASSAPERSPLDACYDTLKGILAPATPAFLTAHPVTGPTFLGGVVANTEEFMRALFGRILGLCPLSRACAAEKNIQLGAAIWHADGIVERGAFEHLSFASKDSIKATLRNFLKYEIRQTDRVYGILEEFEKVCELRHGAVHSGSTMPGKNAVKLKLSKVGGHPQIKVGFAELQECAEVCTTLAVSLNLDLFSVLAKRWATDWRGGARSRFPAHA